MVVCGWWVLWGHGGWGGGRYMVLGGWVWVWWVVGGVGAWWGGRWMVGDGGWMVGDGGWVMGMVGGSWAMSVEDGRWAFWMRWWAWWVGGVVTVRCCPVLPSAAQHGSSCFGLND